jgi:hypothetical protein
MADMRCSRCDRPRPPEEPADIGELVGHLPDRAGGSESIFGTPAPWGSIDGLPVCPACQTAEEQREMARRIVTMVEDEIARMRGKDAEPTSLEAPLIAYAMFLREQLDAITPPPPPPAQ